MNEKLARILGWAIVGTLLTATAALIAAVELIARKQGRRGR